MAGGAGVGLFNQAIQSGFSAAELLLTGSNAQTRAAYDAAYNTAARKLAALNSKNRAERNLAAINQDKINASVVVQQNQAAAEASVKVSAAAAGVKGGSVEDVKYETEKNAAHQNYNAKKQADQERAGQLAAVGSAQTAFLSERESKISYVGELLQAFSSINMQDIKRFGVALDSMGSEGGKGSKST